jgi:hypothetical protein
MYTAKCDVFRSAFHRRPGIDKSVRRGVHVAVRKSVEFANGEADGAPRSGYIWRAERVCGNERGMQLIRGRDPGIQRRRTACRTR